MFNPGDIETLLWFSAEPILGVKECFDCKIDRLAEKMRAMPENDPAIKASGGELAFISSNAWSVRKARASYWLRVFEAHQNQIAMGK